MRKSVAKLRVGFGRQETVMEESFLDEGFLYI